MSTPLRAETFLRELQGAVSSRRLYAPIIRATSRSSIASKPTSRR